MTSGISTEPEIITNPKTELDRFKQKVRRIAIETHHEEGWCMTGLNDALERLGLARYAGPFRFAGSVEVTASAWLEAGDPLTLEQAARHTVVGSTDGDVRITGQELISIGDPDEDGHQTVTFRVSFTVINTDYKESAEDWTHNALEVRRARPYDGGVLQVALTGHDVGDIEWNGQADPDEPENYTDL